MKREPLNEPVSRPNSVLTGNSYYTAGNKQPQPITLSPEQRATEIHNVNDYALRNPISNLNISQIYMNARGILVNTAPQANEQERIDDANEAYRATIEAITANDDVMSLGETIYKTMEEDARTRAERAGRTYRGIPGLLDRRGQQIPMATAVPNMIFTALAHEAAGGDTKALFILRGKIEPEERQKLLATYIQENLTNHITEDTNEEIAQTESEIFAKKMTAPGFARTFCAVTARAFSSNPKGGHKGKLEHNIKVSYQVIWRHNTRYEVVKEKMSPDRYAEEIDKLRQEIADLKEQVKVLGAAEDAPEEPAAEEPIAEDAPEGDVAPEREFMGFGSKLIAGLLAFGGMYKAGKLANAKIKKAQGDEAENTKETRVRRAGIIAAVLTAGTTSYVAYRALANRLSGENRTQTRDKIFAGIGGLAFIFALNRMAQEDETESDEVDDNIFSKFAKHVSEYMDKVRDRSNEEGANEEEQTASEGQSRIRKILPFLMDTADLLDTVAAQMKQLALEILKEQQPELFEALNNYINN